MGVTHAEGGGAQHDGNTVKWDQYIPVANARISERRSDMVWEGKDFCYVIEFSCPRDGRAVEMVHEKINKYCPRLIPDMQRSRPRKKVMLVSIVIGATGAVSTKTVVWGSKCWTVTSKPVGCRK